MARPKKNPSEVRSYKLQIAFNDEEAGVIESARGELSFTEFVRTAAVEKARHNQGLKPTRKKPRAA